MKRRLNARIEYAKFLQDTAKEMAKEVQNSRSGEIKRTAKDLDEFLNKVRSLVQMLCLFVFHIDLLCVTQLPFCSVFRFERVAESQMRKFWALQSCLMMNLPWIISAG